VKASEAWLGAKGTWLAALLSGLVDVDAVTIAIARGSAADKVDQAITGIVLACISNSLFKTGAAITAGAGVFRRDVAIGLLAMAVAGGAVAAVMMMA